MIDIFPFLNNSKNVIAELKELKDCSDGQCDAIYSYTVDNKEYFVIERNVDEKYHYNKIKIYYKIHDLNVYNSGDCDSIGVSLLFCLLLLILIVTILVFIIKRLTNYYYKSMNLKKILRM